MKRFKNIKPVFSNKILTISASAVLLILIFNIQCSADKSDDYFGKWGSHPTAEYNRSLTESEMQLPYDGYRRDFIGERAVMLDISAPTEKPEIQWQREYGYIRHQVPIIDSENGLCFRSMFATRETFDSEEEYRSNISKRKDLDPTPFGNMVRLNPDKTIDWKSNLYSFSTEYTPVAVCDGGVIWLLRTFIVDGTFFQKVSTVYRLAFKLPSNQASLEMIDNDGNTVWRTEIIRVSNENYHCESAWRISNNRMMIGVGNGYSGNFNIYSLADGTLLESIKFPGWYDKFSNNNDPAFNPFEPIEIPSIGWIGFQNDGIVLFDPNLDTIWKYNIPIKQIISRPLINENNLIFNTDQYIASLDLKTGEIIWKIDEYKKTILRGVVPGTGDIVFTNQISNKYSDGIYIADNKGKIIFSNTFRYPKYEFVKRLNNMIFYTDGSFLLRDTKSVRLFDKQGSLKWQLDLSDLGLDRRSYSIENTFTYGPDGGIVLFIQSHTQKVDYIISLGQKN